MSTVPNEIQFLDEVKRIEPSAKDIPYPELSKLVSEVYPKYEPYLREFNTQNRTQEIIQEVQEEHKGIPKEHPQDTQLEGERGLVDESARRKARVKRGLRPHDEPQFEAIESVEEKREINPQATKLFDAYINTKHPDRAIKRGQEWFMKDIGTPLEDEPLRAEKPEKIEADKKLSEEQVMHLEAVRDTVWSLLKNTEEDKPATMEESLNYIALDRNAMKIIEKQLKSGEFDVDELNKLLPESAVAPSIAMKMLEKASTQVGLDAKNTVKRALTKMSRWISELNKKGGASDEVLAFYKQFRDQAQQLYDYPKRFQGEIGPLQELQLAWDRFKYSAKYSILAGLGGIVQTAAEATGIPQALGGEKYAEFSKGEREGQRELRAAAEHYGQQYRPSLKGEKAGTLNWWASVIGETAPSLAISTLSSMAAAGSFVAWAIPVFVMEAGSQYSDAMGAMEKKGYSSEDARKIATATAVGHGAIASALERMPWMALFKGKGSIFKKSVQQLAKSKGWKNVLLARGLRKFGRVVSVGKAEAIQEFWQGTSGDMFAWVYGNSDIMKFLGDGDFKAGQKFFAESLRSLAGGFAGGGMAGAMISPQIGNTTEEVMANLEKLHAELQKEVKKYGDMTEKEILDDVEKVEKVEPTKEVEQKEPTDAVQEREAKEVSVRKEAEVSEEVGKEVREEGKAEEVAEKPEVVEEIEEAPTQEKPSEEVSEPEVEGAEVEPETVRPVEEDETAEPSVSETARREGLKEEGEAVEPTVPDKIKTKADNAAKMAKLRIAKNLKKMGGPLAVGIPLDPKRVAASTAILRDMAIVGAAKMVSGTVNFTKWSEEMVAEFGKAIKGNLHKVFSQSKTISHSWAGEKPTVKQVIKAKTQPEPAEKVIRSESDLLRYALQREARGAVKAWRAGRIDLNATNREIVEIAKELLPSSEWSRLSGAITRKGPRTPAQSRAVIRSINLILESYDRKMAIGEYKKAQKKFKKLKGKIAHYDELEVKIDEILEDLRLNKTRESTLRRYESMLRAAEVDKFGEIPKAQIARGKEILADRDKAVISEMSAEDVMEITDGIGLAIHHATMKGKLLAGARVRELEEVKGEIVGEMDSIVERTKKVVTNYLERRRFIRKTAGIDQQTMMTQVEGLMGRGGTGSDVLIDALVKGEIERLLFHFKGLDHIRKAFKELGISPEDVNEMTDIYKGKAKGDYRKKIKLPTAKNDKGKVSEIEITSGVRIRLLWLLMDPQNRAALLRHGQGYVYTNDLNNENGPIQLGIEDIKAIERNDTVQDSVETSIATSMFEFFNLQETRDAGNKISQKLIGRDLFERDDYAGRARFRKNERAERNSLIRYHKQRWENRGFTKPRTGGLDPIIVGDAFGEYMARLNETASYIGKSLPIQDALRVIDSSDFIHALQRRTKFPKDFISDYKRMLEFYEGLSMGHNKTAIEALVSYFIRNAHVGALGIKPKVAMYQVVSFMLASNEINASYLAKAATSPDLAVTKTEIMRDPQFRSRIEGSVHQIITPGVGGNTFAEFWGIEGKVEKVRDLAMKPIHLMDTQVMYRIWRAAKIEGIEKGLSGEELFDYTSERAWDIVRRTQPVWGPTDISQLILASRGNPMVKLIPGIMFSSQRTQNLNNMVRAVNEYRDSEHTAEDKTVAVRKIFMAGAAQGIGVASLDEAWTVGFAAFAAWLMGRMDDEEVAKWDWDKRLKEWTNRSFGNWIAYGALSTAVGKAVIAKHEGETGVRAIEYALGSDILTSAVVSTLSGIARITETDKTPKQWYRSIADMSRGVSIIAGLPFAGAEQLFRPFGPGRRIKTKKDYYDELWDSFSAGKVDKEAVRWLIKLGANSGTIRSSIKGRVKRQGDKWSRETARAYKELQDVYIEELRKHRAENHKNKE